MAGQDVDHNITYSLYRGDLDAFSYGGLLLYQNNTKIYNNTIYIYYLTNISNQESNTIAVNDNHGECYSFSMYIRDAYYKANEFERS